jgi:hypothetical protein
MTMALAAEGAIFEERNPVTQLMTDRSRGLIKPEILDEKVLSAIVELKTTLSRTEHFIEVIERVAPTLDTVVALGIAAVCDANGGNPIEDLMMRRGYPIIRGKTNLGLGRVTNPAAAPVEMGATA